MGEWPTGEDPWIVYSRRYSTLLGRVGRSGHRKDKYSKVADAILAEGIARPSDFLAPPPLGPLDLALVHPSSYVDRLCDPTLVASILEAPRVSGMSQDEVRERIVAPVLHVSGGTLAAARLALRRGFALNIGGGYHHARSDRGGGFCLVNDVAVTIRRLAAEDLAHRFLVVDLDLHQGDGTAEIFAGEEEVYTFSMHEERNFPFHKARSDLDVGLDGGTGDDAYMDSLRQHLPHTLAASRPDLCLYLAGTDVYAGDFLGRLELSAAGLLERDGYVLRTLREASVPTVFLLAGGYSDDSWSLVVETLRRLGSWGVLEENASVEEGRLS